MVHSAYLEHFEEGLTVSYDPQPDGNCQFDAAAEQLHLYGIHHSMQTLRAEFVSFLQSDSHAELVRHFQSFVTGSWREYVMNMGRDGTFEDHITLDVMLRMYNIQFLVFSTVGPEAMQLISWDGNSRRPEMPLVTLRKAMVSIMSVCRLYYRHIYSTFLFIVNRLYGAQVRITVLVANNTYRPLHRKHSPNGATAHQ